MTNYEKKVKRLHPDMVVYSDSEELAKRVQEDWDKHAAVTLEELRKPFQEWLDKTEKDEEQNDRQ